MALKIRKLDGDVWVKESAGNTSRDSSHFDGSFKLHASSLLAKLTPKYDLLNIFFVLELSFHDS